MNQVPNLLPIGLSTTSTYPASVAETFAYAKGLGYDGVEIMVSYPKATRDLRTLLRLSDRFGLPILAIHAPTLVLTQFTGGRDPLTKLTRSLALAKAVDAPTVVCHPPFRWQNGYSKDFLKIVSDLEAHYETTVAVENMFPWRIRGRNAKIYNPTWEDITASDANLTIDFSHASLAGLDGFEMIRKNYANVAHIHLCDGVGVQKLNGKNQVKDEHMIPGEGTQPIAAALEYLVKTGWTGSIAAEVTTMGMGAAKRDAALLKTIQFARKAMAAELAQQVMSKKEKSLPVLV